jgi:hypothetical protein
MSLKRTFLLELCSAAALWQMSLREAAYLNPVIPDSGPDLVSSELINGRFSTANSTDLVHMEEELVLESESTADRVSARILMFESK